jgi:hypothetical protein
MAYYSKKESIVKAITFEELIEYGKNNGGNMVNGLPWSFNYNGHPVTNENDECYLVCTPDETIKFTPQDILVTEFGGEIYSFPKDLFLKTHNLICK